MSSSRTARMRIVEGEEEKHREHPSAPISATPRSGVRSRRLRLSDKKNKEEALIPFHQVRDRALADLQAAVIEHGLIPSVFRLPVWRVLRARAEHADSLEMLLSILRTVLATLSRFLTDTHGKRRSQNRSRHLQWAHRRLTEAITYVSTMEERPSSLCSPRSSP